jgi:hypothetical protein
MKDLRRLGLHGVLLVVAAVVAFVKAQPDEGPGPLEPGEVELWGGSHKDLARVTYETKRQVVMLERKEDDSGLWYLGKVEPVDQPEEPEEDAGAGGAASPHKPPKPPKPRPVEPSSFASVSVAEKIAKALAPLRAQRAIGEIPADKEKTYGLDEPEGTLTIEVGDKKHVLVVGAPTPGAGSRYVRDANTKLVYVIDAQPIRDIDGGAARLSERSVHAWKFTDVARASISADGQSRMLEKSGTEGREFWADPQTPDVNDETSNNWLRKVQNLRPVQFLEAMPEGASRVVRIEYGKKGDALGFLELHRYKGEGDKDEFAITTEYLRMPATVAQTLGEQVADDLGSLFPAKE